MLTAAVERHWQSGLFMKTLVRRKLADMGFALTEKQIAHVARRLSKGQGNIRINGKRLVNAKTIPRQRLKEPLSVNIGEDDIRGAIDEIDSWIPGVMESTSERLAGRLLSQLRRSGRVFLRDWDRERVQFQVRLARTWGRAFYLLDLFLAVALQSGADFTHRNEKSATSGEGEVVHVLTRLHARACQVTAEVVSLLKSGFADGAHARWRTLHEIAVVSTFIKKHGAETARRYLAHEAVESYRAAKQYQDQCQAIGYEPLNAKEFAAIQKRYDNALQRFGKDFGGSYGWAALSLSRSKPTFSDIEHDVKLDSLSPFYRLASHNVHANPKGITFKLGLGPDRGRVLLAGPSNTGLADPAQSASLSLLHATSAMLGTRPDLDGIVVLKVLVTLQAQIAQTFVEIQRKIESMGSRTTAL
jgi:hypothetical protein